MGAIGLFSLESTFRIQKWMRRLGSTFKLIHFSESARSRDGQFTWERR